MKSFSENRLFRLACQCAKHFKLDLQGLSVLVPIFEKEPCLSAIIAAVAGAEHVYVPTENLIIANAVSKLKEEAAIRTTFHFINGLNEDTTQNIDFIITAGGLPAITADVAAKLKRNCVISSIPADLNFASPQGIDIEACSRNKASIAMLNPSDPTLMLFKYFSHISVKKCYEAGLDVFRSKILLIGSGEMLESTLSHLKTAGAQVYAAYTDRVQDKDYILKHLIDADAILIADYQSKAEIVGNETGLIKTQDIKYYNPDVKIIHVSGKINFNQIEENGLEYWQNTDGNASSIHLGDMGSRALGDLSAAAMKAAESIIKKSDNSLIGGINDAEYNIINSNGPTVLGRIKF